MADAFRFETERLVLRSWREEDIAPFWESACDPEVMRFLLPMANRDEAVERYHAQSAMQAGHGFCFWVIERKADGAFLGQCGLCPPRLGFSEVEIGWRLSRHAWGQGYALEAASGVLGWAWRELDVPSIIAITVRANEPSWRLMDKLGMRYFPDEDFDHPAVPDDSPLKRHIVYRIHRPEA